MTKLSYTALLFLFVLTCAFTCNRKNKPDEGGKEEKAGVSKTTAKDLQGNWVIRSLERTDKDAITPDKYYTLYISSEDLGLPLDVNQCGAGYVVKEDSIDIADYMMCTEMCCDQKHAQVITRFLHGKLHYSIKNGDLKLSNKDGVLTLFQQENSLVNTAWTAVSYQVDKTNTQQKFTNPYTLSFQPMQVTLKLDANNCFGNVSYSKEAFELEKVIGCSRKCCDSKDGILLKDMLGGKNSYTLDEKGQTMTVTTGRGIVVLTKTDKASEE